MTSFPHVVFRFSLELVTRSQILGVYFSTLYFSTLQIHLSIITFLMIHLVFDEGRGAIPVSCNSFMSSFLQRRRSSAMWRQSSSTQAYCPLPSTRVFGLRYYGKVLLVWNGVDVNNNSIQYSKVIWGCSTKGISRIFFLLSL